MNESREIFIPAGIVIAKDTLGCDVTIDSLLRDPSVVDTIDFSTLTEGGCRFILELEEQGIAASIMQEAPNS